MHRKLVWLSILTILFLSWGVSGAAGASHREPLAQSALSGVEATPAVAETTPQALIPVTGRPSLGWGMLIVYGLIGLAALTLILALLDSANQSTTLSARRKAAQEEDHK